MADQNKETKPISNGIQPGPGEHILDKAIQPATTPDTTTSGIGMASSGAGSSGGLTGDAIIGDSTTDNIYTPESVNESLARASADADRYAQDVTDRANGGYSYTSYSGSTDYESTMTKAQNYIRQSPGTVLVGTLVAGFLLTRLMKSSAENRRIEYSTPYSPEKPAVTDRMKQASQSARAKLQESKGTAQARMNEMGQRVQESKEAAQARMNEMTQRLKETAGVAQARMSEIGQRSQEQYTRARSEIDRLIDEQPLIIGVVGIAVGAAIGATLKPTRREQELMGGMRDKLVDKAKEAARAQTETLKQSAQRIAEAAKQEAEAVKQNVSSAGTQDAGKSSSSKSGESGDPQFGGIPGQQSIH